MSIPLSNVLVTQFAEEVKHIYQEHSVLRDTVRVKDASGAKKKNFPVLGRGLAQRRENFLTPIPTMNATREHKEAEVKEYTASELTDIFLQNQVSFDDKMELVQTISAALGRTLDQIILDELAASSIAKTVAIGTGGANTNMNLAKLAEIAKKLDKDGVPSQDRTLALHPNGLHAMLQQEKISSSDYNAIKALVQGDLGSYYGFNFKKIGDRDEGGLPLSTADRTNFAWHKDAVGLAMNMEPRITIDWDAQYGAHRVTGYLAAGAVVVDGTGVVEITTRDTAAATA